MASKRPDGDVWNIVDNDEMSQHYGKNFKFDFSHISSEEIKELFKDYVWQNYRVGNKTLSSLYSEVNSYFYRFIQFAESRNIISLKGLTNVDVENYGKIGCERYYVSYHCVSAGDSVCSYEDNGCHAQIKQGVHNGRGNAGGYAGGRLVFNYVLIDLLEGFAFILGF